MEQKLEIFKDLVQDCTSPLERPEIRVWCHPHYINKEGSDYYEVFKTFDEAMTFCNSHDEAEGFPLIAFRGYEINIFSIGY